VKEVARRCSYSDSAMLAVSASFAAPLLEWTGLQSFGINLFGRSKVGKTAELLAAASLIGIGRESQLPNFAATPAATAELARVFNDLMLPANEVGLLAGKKKEAYAPVRELIYRLSEGRDRARHSASIYASSAQSSQFRTIFVSTAEHSFNEYAAFAQETRDEGEYARCLDVPATCYNRPTIIDRYPEKIKNSDRKQWARRQVIAIRNACEVQHGTALSPYVRFLIQKGAQGVALVRSHMEEFLNAVKDRKLEGALQHAARNFALLYAGGRLGIESGLLPWKHENLLRALSSCLDRALTHIGHHETAPERAQKILRTWLTGKTIAKRKPNSRFSEQDNDGYYVMVQGRRRYTVHFTKFREWFGKDAAALNAAIKRLESKDLVHLKKTDKPQKGHGLDPIPFI
jgi:putative DNA primase/helicase